MSQLETNVVSNDPLLYETPLPYRRVFYPLGFPVTIVTNCQAIIKAAEGPWGRFQRQCDDPPVELRLAVSQSGPAEPPAASLPRAQGHLIATIHDASNFAVCDLRAGFTFGWLTPVVANNAARVWYHFIEPLVLLMLQSRHFTPLHAGCVALNGKGVLLCGESEAGKTTLSYACARRGWTYIADDATGLIRKSTDRTVAGTPYLIGFRPPAALLFPELAGNSPAERPRGKPSLELDTAQLNISIAERSPVDYLVFLNRKSTGGQQLVTYSQPEALARLEEVICIGEESVRAEHRANLRRLLTAPVFEMKYYDLDWAERRLRSLVENGR